MENLYEKQLKDYFKKYEETNKQLNSVQAKWYEERVEKWIKDEEQKKRIKRYVEGKENRGSVDSISYSEPFFMTSILPPIYENRPLIMVIGQETNGWGDISNFNSEKEHEFLIKIKEMKKEPKIENSIRIRHYYGEAFTLLQIDKWVYVDKDKPVPPYYGRYDNIEKKYLCDEIKKHATGQFWKFISCLNNKRYNVCWNNLDKIHYKTDKKKCIKLYNEDEKFLHRDIEYGKKKQSLLMHEIDIVEPDYIIFLTGPNYKDSMVEALEMKDLLKPSIDAPIKYFSVKNSRGKNIPAIWTYHPGYFGTLQQKCEVKNEIMKVLNKYVLDFEHNCNIINRLIDLCSNRSGSTEEKVFKGVSFDELAGDTSFVIPEGFQIIGKDAFRGCSSLINITIPDGITTIDKCAFYGCTSLKSINIPKSVTTIGAGAFANCKSLTNINIPKRVADIGPFAFENCINLTDVTIQTIFLHIDDFAFVGCSNLSNIEINSFNYSHHIVDDCLIEIKSQKVLKGLKNCDRIPADGSVEEIGPFAFRGCKNLYSINIPDCIELIGFGAFTSCENISSIEVSAGNPIYHSDGNCLIETASKTLIAGCENSIIPTDGSATSIEDFAFSDKVNLSSIKIPASITSIEEQPFLGCENLYSIEVNPGNPVYHSDGNCLIETASKTLIAGCKDSVIPADDRVTNIGKFAFLRCKNLTSIDIPEAIDSIGEGAFAECTNLKDISIPSNVKIGELAFFECRNLGNINIPIGDPIIKRQTFTGCASFTKITIPKGITSIEDSVFEECINLTHVIISDTVLSIGAAVFCNCTNLNTINIPKSISHIGDGVFAQCYNLRQINYEGTIDEFGLIQKGNLWQCESSLEKVICIDGDIIL